MCSYNFIFWFYIGLPALMFLRMAAVVSRCGGQEEGLQTKDNDFNSWTLWIRTTEEGAKQGKTTLLHVFVSLAVFALDMLLLCGSC